MPFYEYECQKCKTQFEELISISTRDEEEAALKCPKCGAGELHRIVSKFATQQGESGPKMSSSAPSCSSGG